MGRSGDDDRDSFEVSGPTHLTQTEIDWDNDEHRRCVTASLVKGTYVLESDRTKKRENTPHALAPAWWETFHFRKLPEYKFERVRRCAMCEMRRILGGKLFIYGAVFEYAPPDGVPRHPSAPSHIVAFRGTMTRDPTVLSDMLQDLRILINKQHTCGRFTTARENVQRLLCDCEEKQKADDDSNGGGRGGEKTWLAGHSLGASIALDVGRHMMIHDHGGLNLPTFLFNPPHASLAPAIGKHVRQDVYAVGYFLKYALMSKVIPSSHKNHMEQVFEKLRTWVPHVYVNPRDAVCKGYIHYFEQRQRMMERHPSVATLASKLSFRDMWRSLWGKQSERPHLLPSVILWKNTGTKEKDAHALRQWWSSELDLKPIEYSWSGL